MSTQSKLATIADMVSESGSKGARGALRLTDRNHDGSQLTFTRGAKGDDLPTPKPVTNGGVSVGKAGGHRTVMAAAPTPAMSAKEYKQTTGKALKAAAAAKHEAPVSPAMAKAIEGVKAAAKTPAGKVAIAKTLAAVPKKPAPTVATKESPKVAPVAKEKPAPKKAAAAETADGWPEVEFKPAGECKKVHADSMIGKVIAAMAKDKGATGAELCKLSGWKPGRLGSELGRHVNANRGYGIASKGTGDKTTYHLALPKGVKEIPVY